MAEHAEELGLNGHFKAGEEHAFFFTLFDANQDGCAFIVYLIIASFLFFVGQHRALNRYLDGHELRLSLHDTKAHDEGMPKVKALETRVDEMLRKYDVDRDGRLSLGESLSMQ